MNRLKNFKMFEAYNVINGKLDVSNKDLATLPKLPDDITELYCSGNNLTSLPELPKSLKILKCNFNHLTSLPELPDGLRILYIINNNITSLPELPKSLEIFYCYDNPLECLIPNIFLLEQNDRWLKNYYYNYIDTYDGQKKILINHPNNAKLLEQQTKILPEIKEEFAHLFTGTDLNLI